MFMFPVNSLSLFMEMKNRIRNRFKKPVDLPPDSKRTVTVLPGNGGKVSVEKALNSRCTSDYDDAPELSHWGMFNRYERLSAEQINQIADHIRIPRLTVHPADVLVNRNVLTFVIDSTVSGIQRDWLMIESGMQQQAIGLICAALGVGMVFRNCGKDGTGLSESAHANVKIKLDAMKPSYGGSYWNTQAPAGFPAPQDGGLPEPDRIGRKSLLAVLAGVPPRHSSSLPVTETGLGQLLWAARGRTPHLYKSRAWGMTIPTWGGTSLTGLYVITDRTVWTYVNWKKNKPMHSLKPLGVWARKETDRLVHGSNTGATILVLETKERSGRALWEAGYQLLNILLQAYSLGIGYEPLLLDETRKAEFRKSGIQEPVVAVVLHDGNNRGIPSLNAYK